MMTHANAASTTTDPVAAALAIAENARRKADGTEERHGMAGVIALAVAVLLSLTVVGAVVVSPAAIPTFCATHACPTIPTFQHTS
jgi:hypothetical protein